MQPTAFKQKFTQNRKKANFNGALGPAESLWSEEHIPHSLAAQLPVLIWDFLVLFTDCLNGNEIQTRRYRSRVESTKHNTKEVFHSSAYNSHQLTAKSAFLSKTAMWIQHKGINIYK